MEKKGNTKFILIVDDEPNVLELLSEVLAEEDVIIYTAKDGAEAMDIILNRHIDFIISDLAMPHMSGAELLAHIRRIDPRLPVLIITGRPTLDAAVECMREGAVDFISKPFDIIKFRKQVFDILSKLQQKEEASPHTLREIAGYQIRRTIGEGVSGIVFEVEKNQHPYALKVFKFTGAQNSRIPELRERFEREAKFLQDMHHPNIIRVFEWGITPDNIHYLVMELVQGISLKKKIQSNPSLPEKEAAGILKQIANALATVHQQGAVHRDIKPDNILISEDGVVKLTDFGILRLPNSNLTMAANLMGSPAYLAPEGFVSARVDYRSDLFSLGVVAYELFVGRRPFLADSIYAIAAAIQGQNPPNPLRLRPELSPSVEIILAHLLVKNPAYRLASAQLASEAFARIEKGESLEGLPLPPLYDAFSWAE